MRPYGTFLVILSCAFGMAACEGRDFFEELRPEPVGALNGHYREKTSQGLSQDPEAYSELLIDEGTLYFVGLGAPSEANPAGLQKTAVAKINPGEGITYDLQSTPELETLSAEDSRATFLKQAFHENSKVRILRQGNDLKVTEIRGPYRKTTTWEKLSVLTRPDGQVLSRDLQKASVYNEEIKKLREEFIVHWGNETMEVFEKIEIRTFEGISRTQVTPQSKLLEQDEVLTRNEDGSNGKYSLRINRIKLVSTQEALINDAHPAELQFSLKTNSAGKTALYLKIISAADPFKYQARSIEGFVEMEGTGFRLSYLPGKDVGYKAISTRYYPKGSTGMTPTESTDPGATSEEKPPVQPAP